MRLYVIAGMVSTAWFHPTDEDCPDKPRSLFLFFAKNAFTKSLGTLSVSGLVLTFVEFIKGKADKSWCLALLHLLLFDFVVLISKIIVKVSIYRNDCEVTQFVVCCGSAWRR